MRSTMAPGRAEAEVGAQVFTGGLHHAGEAGAAEVDGQAVRAAVVERGQNAFAMGQGVKPPKFIVSEAMAGAGAVGTAFRGRGPLTLVRGIAAPNAGTAKRVVLYG